MTAQMAVGLALALASTAALNGGFFAQQTASSTMPRLSVRSPLRSLGALFSNRRWLLGFAVGLGGWALYIAALGFAPLSLVQAVSAGGIGLLALLSNTRDRLTRAETLAAGVALVGLLLLGISLRGSIAARFGPPAGGVWAWVGGSAAFAAAAAGMGSSRLLPGAGLGLASGALYAAGDVATKAATVGGGPRIWFVIALLACHGLAFAALQLGFQRGGVLATAGLSMLVTNSIPIAAGVILFHERIPRGPQGALRIIGFVMVIAAAVLLSARQTQPHSAPVAGEPADPEQGSAGN